MTVDWLRQLVGLPEEFSGHIEDTASTGVLAAAIVARSQLPDRRVLVCSEHAHSVGEKAAAALADFIVLDMFANVCTGREDAKGAIKIAERQAMRLYR